MKEQGKTASIALATTYDKLLTLLPPARKNSNELVMKKKQQSLESPDLPRASSNLSDLEIDIASQISGNELLEDRKFDAGHVYKNFKNEVRNSHSNFIG